MSDEQDRELFAEKLQEVFSPEEVDREGRGGRQSERLGKTIPFRPSVALVVALGAPKVE